MSDICPGCNGVVGVDCFNVAECVDITRQMNEQAAIENYLYYNPPAPQITPEMRERCYKAGIDAFIKSRGGIATDVTKAVDAVLRELQREDV